VRLKVTGKRELSFIHNFHRSRIYSKLGVSKNNLYLISSNIFRARIAELKEQIAGLRVEIAELGGNISDVQYYRNIQMLLIKNNLSRRRAGGSLTWLLCIV
jgi:hypothetical protein